MRYLHLTLLLLASLIIGCGDAKDLIEITLDPPERETIDVSRVGLNNFFVDPQFGSIDQQYAEIRNTLGIRSIRILLAWTDGVQPNPNSSAFYGFYDDILDSVPPGVDIIVVLAHTPNWMFDSNNWIGGNPTTTWIERWLKPTVTRYRNAPGIIGFEVWNEPDLTVVPSDIVLGLEDADTYFAMLQAGSDAIRSIAPGKLVLNAATQSIQQNFPTTLNYNRRLRDLGAENLVDVWNVHYYGRQFENIITGNGVADFLNSIPRPIWITESGEDGPDQQLAYVETAWPFLRDEIPSIDRIYYYQFGETVTPLELNFGLRTPDPNFPVSDLYVHLRDRAQ